MSGSVVEEGSLHGAALDGWALLLSLLSDDHAAEVLRNHPPSVARLGDLLEACSLDVSTSIFLLFCKAVYTGPRWTAGRCDRRPRGRGVMEPYAQCCQA